MAVIKSFIKFKDGTILPTLAVYSKKEYYQGSSREIFDIRMPSDGSVTFEQIQNVIAVEGNTSKITLIEAHYDAETGDLIQELKFEHPDYDLIIDSGIRNTDDFEYFNLTLARLTPNEVYQQENEIEIEEQAEAIIELADIIADQT